jgi:CarD family transcriptional regulator
MGSRENIEQGRGSSARRLCHRKRVKRVLPRPSKKAAAASRSATKSRARASLKIPQPPRPRLQILEKQKKRNAKQDCKNCRESDGFEGHCFEGRRLQDCSEKTPAKAPPRPSPTSRLRTSPPPSRPKAARPRVEEPKKVLTQRQGFKTNEFVVYPAHGVGQILAIEDQEIAGAKLELFVINFMKDKMTLRVPTAKVANVGMRKLSEPALVKRALETLKGRARVKRTMWSRRAQEYEAKINSGDIVAIAEVVRDLYRSESQPEQSYSERQLYEAALDRLSREIAVVQHVDGDRGGQGNRKPARQEPAPRRQDRGRSRGRR